LKSYADLIENGGTFMSDDNIKHPPSFVPFNYTIPKLDYDKALDDLRAFVGSIGVPCATERKETKMTLNEMIKEKEAIQAEYDALPIHGEPIETVGGNVSIFKCAKCGATATHSMEYSPTFKNIEGEVIKMKCYACDYHHIERIVGK
jgi:hypothetical protein